MLVLHFRFISRHFAAVSRLLRVTRVMQNDMCMRMLNDQSYRESGALMQSSALARSLQIASAQNCLPNLAALMWIDWESSQQL